MTHQSSQSGFSLIELVIVLAIMGIIMVLANSGLLNRTAKAYDATRKSDLAKIKVAFEDFYNDNDHYPAANILADACLGRLNDGLQPYLDKIPCDPKTNEAYLYMPDAPSGGYRVFTKLDSARDPDAERLGCGGVDGCGVPDHPEYNYGISEGLRVALIEPPAPGDVTPGASVAPTATPRPTIPPAPVSPTPTGAQGGYATPTITPTVLATPTATPFVETKWCDYKLGSLCYVCSDRCNNCHVTSDPSTSCAGSIGSPQAYLSFQACLEYSACTE